MEDTIRLTETDNYVINVDQAKLTMAECSLVLNSLGIPF